MERPSPVRRSAAGAEEDSPPTLALIDRQRFLANLESIKATFGLNCSGELCDLLGELVMRVRHHVIRFGVYVEFRDGVLDEYARAQKEKV